MNGYYNVIRNFKWDYEQPKKKQNLNFTFLSEWINIFKNFTFRFFYFVINKFKYFFFSCNTQKNRSSFRNDDTQRRKVYVCNVIVSACKTLLKLKFVQKDIFSQVESVAAHLSYFLSFFSHVEACERETQPCDDHSLFFCSIILSLFVVTFTLFWHAVRGY